MIATEAGSFNSPGSTRNEMRAAPVERHGARRQARAALLDRDPS